MLRLDNLSVTYGPGMTALSALALDLYPGEFTVLLGASGAGKSTLLRCLNHLTRPTAGQVIVEGLGNLSQPDDLREHRKQTGMIFQQHQLLPRCTAFQNVLKGRLAYYPAWRTVLPLPQRDQCIALECLDRVGLLHKALTRVSALSGGQQQRVGIARSLAQKPRLLLADEPVASLDPASAHKVLSFLHKICREDGILVIVSLHQVDLAIAYADCIIGLAHGHVVFDGSPKTLDSAQIEQLYRHTAVPITT
ncbi:MAG: phosphonate ABC transporter ATP-binding protein [Cyanobacteria bacterium P01_D01_bin.115]